MRRPPMITGYGKPRLRQAFQHEAELFFESVLRATEFLQRTMQPQLFWEANNRTPLQTTHRGRVERLLRYCRDKLYGVG